MFLQWIHPRIISHIVKHHPDVGTPFDEYGHGTFVNYEIAWLLQKKCENAEQISYKCFDSSGGSGDNQFLDALKEAEDIRPDVVSISAGAGIPLFDSVNDNFSRNLNNLLIIYVTVLIVIITSLVFCFFYFIRKRRNQW